MYVGISRERERGRKEGIYLESKEMEESLHPGFWAAEVGSKRFLEQLNERIAHTSPATQPLVRKPFEFFVFKKKKAP